MFNDYKIIREIGRGKDGIVYLVEKDNKNYAMKKEKIHPKIKREIDFFQSFANKYPEYFNQLIEYDIEGNYSRKIYDWIPNFMSNTKLSLKEYYSIFIQLIHILHLLNKNGYVYLDVHPGNIGLVKTNNKFITINGKNVPTFGNLVKLIDFSNILHIKYPMTDKEKYIYKMGLEKEILLGLGNLSFDMTPLFKQWPKNFEYTEVLNKIKENLEYQDLKKYSRNDKVIFDLFSILYPEKFQRILFKNNFKKTIPIKKNIPVVDIINIVKNYNNYNRLINYFIEKIEILEKFER